MIKWMSCDWDTSGLRAMSREDYMQQHFILEQLSEWLNQLEVHGPAVRPRCGVTCG